MLVLFPSHLPPTISGKYSQHILASCSQPEIIATKGNIGGGAIGLTSVDFGSEHVGPIARPPYVGKAINGRRRDISPIGTAGDGEHGRVVRQPRPLHPG